MNFAFYRADAAYCDFLRRSDPCVPYTMDAKSSRPFVGIVFSVNGYNYYAPLTSPKQKHLKMKNQIDFLKINGGEWGAINFNNMIPIHNSSLQPIEIQILPTDDKEIVDYKNLLANQLSWCNKNENAVFIMSKAQKLYDTIISNTARPQLAKRCCNFALDEEQYRIYCRAHNLKIGERSEETIAGLPKQNDSSRKKSIKELLSAAQAEADRRNEAHARSQTHKPHSRCR